MCRFLSTLLHRCLASIPVENILLYILEHFCSWYSNTCGLNGSSKQNTVRGCSIWNSYFTKKHSLTVFHLFQLQIMARRNPFVGENFLVFPSTLLEASFTRGHLSHVHPIIAGQEVTWALPLNLHKLCATNSVSSKAEITWSGNRQVHAQRGRKVT